MFWIFHRTVKVTALHGASCQLIWKHACRHFPASHSQMHLAKCTTFCVTVGKLQCCGCAGEIQEYSNLLLGCAGLNMFLCLCPYREKFAFAGEVFCWGEDWGQQAMYPWVSARPGWRPHIFSQRKAIEQIPDICCQTLTGSRQPSRAQLPLRRQKNFQ